MDWGVPKLTSPIRLSRMRAHSAVGGKNADALLERVLGDISSDSAL